MAQDQDSTPLADLVARRRKQGLSLSQISEATKIGRRYLEAIELGRFQALPGGVYDISYLRQYARAVQFDEEDLVAHYRRVTAPPETVVKSSHRLRAVMRSYAASLLA